MGSNMGLKKRCLECLEKGGKKKWKEENHQ